MSNDEVTYIVTADDVDTDQLILIRAKSPCGCDNLTRWFMTRDEALAGAKDLKIWHGAQCPERGKS